jgi:hypothetical protein
VQDVEQSVAMLSVVIPTAILPIEMSLRSVFLSSCPDMLSVVELSVIILSVILQSVVMLSVEVANVTLPNLD